MNQDTQEITFTEEKLDVNTGLTGRVILFNDEDHDFNEVVHQVIKAIRCNLSKAREITYKAHSTGSSIVFSGDFAACLRVSSILEEIDLLTQIEC